MQEDETVEVGAVLAVVGEADQAAGGGADATGPTADEARLETSTEDAAPDVERRRGDRHGQRRYRGLRAARRRR